MNRRRFMGIAIFCMCIAGFFTYSYLVMLSEWGKIVLELSVLMIVGGILGTVAWIGYTMATTKRVPSWYGPDDRGDAPPSTSSTSSTTGSATTTAAADDDADDYDSDDPTKRGPSP